MSKKIAIITGASGGIGKDLVRAFTVDGYEVVAVDIVPSDVPNFYQVDLSQKEEIQKLFVDIRQKFNTAHILINNAGISNPQNNLIETDIDKIDYMLDVNLRAMILCSREFITLNKGQDYGRIINISSTRWHQNEEHCDIYGATKGGVVSFTNSLCVSLSDTPITVNAISPGWIATKNYDSLTEVDHTQHPSRRVGRVDDIARACSFLVDERNDFINGNNLIIDGGMTKRMIYF